MPVHRARGGTSSPGFSVPKFFSLNNTRKLVIHMYKAFFFPAESLAYFTHFCFVCFWGEHAGKGGWRAKQQGVFFCTPKKRWSMNHGGGATYQFPARGYFANTLILIPRAYTIQLRVLTTVIVICVLCTISESPCCVANVSSSTSLHPSPPLFALCL